MQAAKTGSPAPIRGCMLSRAMPPARNGKERFMTATSADRTARTDGRTGFSPAVLPALVLWVAFAVCAALTGCEPRASEARPMIAASIHPLGALAREIAGPDADIAVLLSPGASPHHFEPTPKAVVEGSRASLVIRVGIGLDDWTRPLVRDALRNGASEILVADLIDSLLPALAQDEVDEHGGAPPEHPEGPADPHVWLDPVAMIPVCAEIGRHLSRIDPEHAGAYERRVEACSDSLRALDAQLRAILQPAAGVPFVATHNAWSYLCRRYGLRQAEVVQRVATREPGPRRLVEIIEAAAQSGCKAVFTEVQGSEASARTVALEQKLAVVMLDPQGTSQDPARDRYFDLMRWNARRMAAALAPNGAPSSAGTRTP